MKRLIITGPCEAIFEEVPQPECPPDGLVVKARMTAISTGTEIRVFRAKPVDDAGKFLHERIPFQLPTENGYSMVGDVVEVGSDISEFKTGDRIYSASPHKQFAVTPAELAVKIPSSIPDEQAVFLNILEVGHIALRRGTPSPGENVAIIGQGVIGLGALAYCQAFGFRTVAVDMDEKRLEIARQMGADLTIRADGKNAVQNAIDFCDGHGADLVIEAASTWSGTETGMQMAANDARIVVAARHTDVPKFNPVGHPHLGKKLTLLTSYGYEADGQRWDRHRSRALTLGLLEQGKLPIEPMLTHEFHWEQIPEVYSRLDQGETDIVGAVIRW